MRKGKYVPLFVRTFPRVGTRLDHIAATLLAPIVVLAIGLRRLLFLPCGAAAESSL